MPSVVLTRRGWALLGAVTGLLVAGRLLGVVELAVLAVAGFGLLAGAYWWASTRRPTLELERVVHPGRVHVGADARVDLTVRNCGSASTPQTTLTDTFDGGRRVARFLVAGLPAGEAARVAYRVPTGRRGRYSLGPARLSVLDPFGFARRRFGAGDLGEITVCPRVHEIRAPIAAAGRRPTSSSPAPRFRAPALDGEEFLTLRAYEVGDDLRRIHWRTTARLGDLVVRQDEAQWQPRTVVLLDTRASEHDDASFELAVEVVASLVVRLARSGTPFEVVNARGSPLGPAGAGRASGALEALLMDRLAVVQPERSARRVALGGPLRAGTRRGLLVAVVGAPAQPDLDRLGALASRHAPVVVVRTRAGEPVASTPALSIVDATPRGFARAWDAAVLARVRSHERVRA